MGKVTVQCPECSEQFDAVHMIVGLNQCIDCHERNKDLNGTECACPVCLQRFGLGPWGSDWNWDVGGSRVITNNDYEYTVANVPSATSWRAVAVMLAAPDMLKILERLAALKSVLPEEIEQVVKKAKGIE